MGSTNAATTTIRSPCGSVTTGLVAVRSAAQRPVTEVALTAGLPADAPTRKSIPSWFVFGDNDLNISVARYRSLHGQPAGAKAVREVPGASHALSVSQPEAVAVSALDAVDAITA